MTIWRCPETTCFAPAWVEDVFVLDSTDGPVAHVRTRCTARHWFTPTADALLTWPVTAPSTPDAETLRT